MLLQDALKDHKDSLYMRTHDADDRPLLAASYQGINITIENDTGSIREGVSVNGTPWQTTFLYPYGFINETQGQDGEEVDCFIGPNPYASMVFIIHQRVGGQYDEDKVMFGFNDAETARDAYLAHFNTQGTLGTITQMTVVEFKEWMAMGQSTQDADEPAGSHWVTVSKGQGKYRRILLDKDGVIIGGDVPKEQQGKNINEIGEKQAPAQTERKTHLETISAGKMSRQQAVEIHKQVSGWPQGEKKGMALTAYGASGHNDTHLLKEGKEIKAISSTSIKGDQLHVDRLSTKEAGYGKEAMEDLFRLAAKNNKSISIHSHEGAKGFYKKLGMKEQVVEGESYFSLTAAEVKEKVK